jgi:hypothetical protein
MRRDGRRPGKARRPYWTDTLESFARAFEERTGVTWRRDDRVRRAANPWFHTGPTNARRRGRPADELFNACVVATTDLVAQLQGTRRHDWTAVTMAIISMGGWGPSGHGTPFTPGDEKVLRRELGQLRERIEETYRRVTRRRDRRN